mmetsp:Transcript_6330/g.9648  ORF Transcript_6330/g.9648 Transcript_6330/m.9648 type:complete len:259 (-) Transcript_6330:165-941(-)
MYTRFSKRRRIAASNSHGTLVAPSTSTSDLFPTPSICTKNSVLIRRAESDSPSLRLPVRESTSSMKMMDLPPLPPDDSRAISNKLRTRRSLSPCHLLTKSAEDTVKKVESASVATALAKNDFPVPGGPYSKIPLKGRRFPVNNCGKRVGIITVSFRVSFAISNPATSDHFTLGFSVTIAPAKAPLNFRFSSSSDVLSSLLFVAAPPGPSLSTSFCSLRCCLSCSARFIYPSTRSMSNFRRALFFSYFRPKVNLCKASR